MEKKLKKVADAGNYTDTVIGHLTVGEVVVPYELAKKPDVKAALKEIFQSNDVSLNEFTVGNSENKINLDTGHPEFFLKWLFGGGGGDKKKKEKKKQEEQQRQQEQQAADQAAQLNAQLAAMQKKMEEERAKMEAERKERERQEAIRSQNQKATDIRRSSEIEAKSNLQSMAENQRKLDQQAAQSAPSVAGSGYNIGTAQQQKISAAGGVGVAGPAATTAGYGGVAGPASTNAPSQTGMPVTTNEGAGGTRQPANRFTLPPVSGLQFGGV